MALHQPLEASTSLPKQPQGHRHVVARSPKGEDEWFTTREAAVYLRYHGKHQLRSLYRFLDRKGIYCARRCRTLLIAKADLDRAIDAAHRVRVE